MKKKIDYTSVPIFRGFIEENIAFPKIENVQSGYWYIISEDVCDDAGVGFTNTKQSFKRGQEIVWIRSKWIIFKDNICDECKKKDEQIAQLDQANDHFMRNIKDHRFVDATPDEYLAVRILQSYIDDTTTCTDNLLGLPPTNPIIIATNEAQEKRNVLIEQAIKQLQRV